MYSDHCVRIFAEIEERCDGVQIDILFTDRFVNLVEESFDIAIRAGALSDSTLMARTLGSLEFLPVASPRYLRKHGRPRSSDDLGNHRCLVFGVGPQTATWRLIREDETCVVDLTPVLSANDLDILHDAVVGGVGIAVLPAYRCVEDLRAGRLERVLPEWGCPDAAIHALYPSGRHLSPKVKLMLDHLQKMTPAPWKLVHSGGAEIFRG